MDLSLFPSFPCSPGGTGPRRVGGGATLIFRTQMCEHGVNEQAHFEGSGKIGTLIEMVVIHITSKHTHIDGH